jgi:hypothetical protein
LICQRWSGENPSVMITLLLHLLRLLPSLCGGHRPLALENVALRQQLAVYKRTASRPTLRRSGRPFWGRSVQNMDRVEERPRHRGTGHGAAVAAAARPRALDENLRAAHRAAHPSTLRSGPLSHEWLRRTPCGVPLESMVGSRAGAVRHAPVSSPRPIERRERIPRTPLSCRLRVKGYGTYRAGRIFKHGPTTPDSR